MPNMSKIRVMTANAGSHRQDLSCDHITTMNFMQLQPIYYRHMVPGEHIKVDVSAFTRLQPMSVPSFGRCRMNIRAFWIPFRVVCPQWTSFKEDTYFSDATSSAIVTSSPHCQIKDFTLMFTSDSSLFTGVGASATHYDYVVGNSYYLLTAKGRRFYKILHSLGYRWEWDGKCTESVSMLGLLCYAKAYCDWYTLSAYLNSQDFLALQEIFAYNSPTTPRVLGWQDIDDILSFVDTVSYDGDWLTAAWDTPVSPNLSNFSNISWSDITTDSPNSDTGSISLQPNGTPVMTQLNAGQTYIGSQYLHSALRKISDFMARHRLSGARDIDRYLVDWGVNLDSAKLNRSIYLGNNSIDIEIGDVMSHADTSSAELGDYAGRGFGNGSKFFEYDTDEFGLFLVVASILPYGGYFQGMDRNNLHISKYDFYTKDFDALSVSLISKREVYTGKDESFYTTAYPAASGFGYSGMYYEYKRPLSFVTGDMELDTVNAGKDAWHLMRILQPSTPQSVVHSATFCRGLDWEQYNRIFNDTTSDSDKFNVIFHMGVSSQMPGRSLFEVYDFEDVGKAVTLDANGTKMN